MMLFTTLFARLDEDAPVAQSPDRSSVGVNEDILSETRVRFPSSLLVHHLVTPSSLSSFLIEVAWLRRLHGTLLTVELAHVSWQAPNHDDVTLTELLGQLRQLFSCPDFQKTREELGKNVTRIATCCLKKNHYSLPEFS